MEVLDADDLGYEDFCRRFLAANAPVKLRGVAHKWFAPATAQWVAADGGINFAALAESYGHAIVPVRLASVVAWDGERSFRPSCCGDLILGLVHALYFASVPKQVVDGDVVEYGAESRSSMRFGGSR